MSVKTTRGYLRLCRPYKASLSGHSAPPYRLPPPCHDRAAPAVFWYLHSYMLVNPAVSGGAGPSRPALVGLPALLGRPERPRAIRPSRVYYGNGRGAGACLGPLYSSNASRAPCHHNQFSTARSPLSSCFRLIPYLPWPECGLFFYVSPLYLELAFRTQGHTDGVTLAFSFMSSHFSLAIFCFLLALVHVSIGAAKVIESEP